MTIFELLGGILLGFGAFAAMFWALWQAFVTNGLRRWLHAGAGLGTLAGMATISLVSPILALIAGAVTVACALALTFVTPGWTRLLPLALALFGTALVLGLPF
ncbi:hypothetical protein [Pontivivens ytuae]|uniref:Uncharacterized protein n=1 Tax=Pontivivens ytuae TaxID=2789856 RepID=A0A7S9QD41_9RHOB|nr:hypothetical protein [Pontivivens ytuae]QPH53751.1 hypothetical protein I0K15_18540 [Pontivivens ytuae]